MVELAFVGGVPGGMEVAILLPLLITLILPIAGLWKTFEKAGEPGWAAIVPI